MHSNSPRPAVEDPEPPTDDDSDDEDNDLAPPSIDDELEDENNDPPPLMEDDDSDDESNDDLAPDEQLAAQSECDDYGPPHPNTIVLPVETRPIEELRDGARRTSYPSPDCLTYARLPYHSMRSTSDILITSPLIMIRCQYG